MQADELADLLRWCTALSTDPADLAGAVVLAAGPRWSRLVDSPPDLRELTVRTFLRIAEAAEAIPRHFTDRIPEELRVVVVTYDKLPKLQRAVVMLSCLEGVTYAEIAAILDRSSARIGIELDRALAMINADPYAVRAALDITTWQCRMCGHLPRSSAPRQEPRSTSASDRAHRSRRRDRAGRTRDSRRDPSARYRAAKIRGMDVLPHGSTNARLVHPEPDRRTRLGNHDSARRAT